MAAKAMISFLDIFRFSISIASLLHPCADVKVSPLRRSLSDFRNLTGQIVEYLIYRKTILFG